MIPSTPPPPQDPREKRQRLQHLSALAADSGSLNDDVVTPLTSTLTYGGAAIARSSTWQVPAGAAETPTQISNLAQAHLSPAMQGMTNGLGTTGSALSGVAGIKDLVVGVEKGDAGQTLSGAADVTTSAGALASAGLIGGALVLTPAGGVLTGLRGLHELRATDRSTRLSGASDLVSGGTLVSSVSEAPLALTLGLGLGATALGAIQGLHSIKQAHDTNNVAPAVTGTGKILAAAGIGLIATGVGLAPGLGLIVAGSALPLLRLSHRARPAVDRIGKVSERLLYPAANQVDKGLDWTGRVTKPALHRIGGVASPVLAPLARLQDRATEAVMKAARGPLDALASTPVAQAVDHAAGKFQTWLARHTDQSSSDATAQ
ncbi:MAG: hypothetical protein ACYCW6_15380 [Candidatus Xenobia bacterium]